MNYETKRDVFEVAMNHAAKSRWVDYSEMMNRYDAALPDDIPTIPKHVSKEIKDVHEKYSLLDELALAWQDALPSSEVSEWVNDNETLFAEAWSRGLWLVEGTGEIVKLEAEK